MQYRNVRPRMSSFIFQQKSLFLLPLLILIFVSNITSPVFAAPVNNKYLPFVKKSLMYDVAAVDGVVVVVGERGFVLLSNDAGKSWTQVEVPVEVALTGVYFLNAELGWAVGYDHVIIRTCDGGKSWKRLYDNIEADGPLLDVWFRDVKNGFAIGSYGVFMTTTDGGDSWNVGMLNLERAAASGQGSTEDEEFSDYHLNQIAKSDSGKLYIAAEAGHMYRSVDNGVSWVSMSSPYVGSFYGVLPLAGESLLMFGLRGNLFRSDDSGVSWLKIKTGTKALLTSGLRLNDGTILVCGNRGVILVSRDGGHSFKVQRPVRKGISSCASVDDKSLILVGAFGVKKINKRDLTLSKKPTLSTKEN